MKHVILILFLITLIGGCGKKYDPANYFSNTQLDSLKVEIITYIYQAPEGATSQTRFEKKFRPYYVSQLPKFNLEKLYKNEAGKYYFYMRRPARSSQGNLRDVGGSFYLDQSGRIHSFREIFNTPVGSIEELKLKGDILFDWIIKHDNVNEHMLNPDLIEWPTEWSYYDTVRYEWVSKPGY
ncbi:MAG: hypothetical protein KF856_09195 [Cyclobacteriaceae bacterium]|nr:hypothetical protein [Cyclobacteriaceae bacterium]